MYFLASEASVNGPNRRVVARSIDSLLMLVLFLLERSQLVCKGRASLLQPRGQQR
jgi:hypothetical protein